MYIPAHFSLTEPAALHQIIRAHPLGALVTQGPDGLDANHLPFELDAERGVLSAHVARANPVWQQCGAGMDVLVIFRGEASYISPNWYPSKHEHHRQVPTWNYEVVHARGVLTVQDDATFVRGVLARLTRVHEAAEPQPWRMTDSAPEFIDTLLAKVIVHHPLGFDAALQRARRALAEFRLDGVDSNIAFLQAILAHEDLAAYGVTTRWLGTHASTLLIDAAHQPRPKALTHSWHAGATADAPGVAPRAEVPEGAVPLCAHVPGSLVQLTDDRYAMVVGVNSTRPLKPRVLVHDRRNTGASDIVIDGEDTEEEIWADDLVDLMRQLGAERAFYGGSSAGSGAAVASGATSNAKATRRACASRASKSSTSLGAEGTRCASPSRLTAWI